MTRPRGRTIAITLSGTVGFGMLAFIAGGVWKGGRAYERIESELQAVRALAETVKVHDVRIGEHAERLGKLEAKLEVYEAWPGKVGR